MAIRKRTWRTQKGEAREAWIAEVWRKSDDGKLRRHLKTFARKSDARDWEGGKRPEAREGTFIPDSESVTVREAADLWIERAARRGREESTVRQYKQHREHLKPLHDVKLSRLTAPRVHKFVEDMEAEKGTTMVRIVLSSLKGILRNAQRRGLVSQNVAEPVKVDSNGRQKPALAIPTKDEMRRVLDSARERGGRDYPLVVVAAFCGLRASELRGLRWQDVDLDKRVLRVEQRADKWQQIGPPKSKAGRREIPMARLVVAALREWKLACPKGDLDLVFPNGAGKVEALTNVYRRVWKPLCADAGLADKAGKPRYRWHDLRHFAASWFIEQGFAPKRVQVLVGHSSILMTFDTYGHLFESLADDHARLDAASEAFMGGAA